MKRSSSECNDDSEQDLVGSSSEFQDRRKRRGMIEKKRRDRINESLIELQHLVPMAMEKKGTSKLEKAELLEMTVNHMKSLLQAKKNAKGISNGHEFLVGNDTNNNLPAGNISDYKVAGFMKCTKEIDNFLANMEGSGKENPSRYRLTQHLEKCCTRLCTKKAINDSGSGSASDGQINPRPMIHMVSSGIPTVNTAPQYRNIVPTPTMPPFSWLGTSNLGYSPIIPVQLPDGTSVHANSYLNSSVTLSPAPITPIFSPVPQPVRFASVPSLQPVVGSKSNGPV